MSSEHRTPGLGPHLIGRRVVVRRVLRGETGPSGGPALTDLLGVMESWAAGVATVRAESGEVTTITIADIVSGKAVPPRPSVRHRISAERAELRANASWPALETVGLGEWLLRASDGYTARANSALSVGDPGRPFESAAAAVTDFYDDHGLPPWAQVVVGSDVHHCFETQGWVPARPGEEDTLFQIASVARASRAVRRLLPPVVPEVSLSTTAGREWLAAGNRAPWPGPAAVRVLEGPDEVGFASVAHDPNGSAGRDALLAKGRAARSHQCGDDWVAISNVWVSPDHQRQRLAFVVIAALLEWGAERGASTAYLQTRGDNPGALAVYERLGFVTHHAYRYLTTG